MSTNTVILVLPGTFLENVRFSYVSRRAGGHGIRRVHARQPLTRRRRFGWLGQPSHRARCGVGRPRPANTRKGGTRGGIVTVRNAERLRDDDAPGTSEPRMPHVFSWAPVRVCALDPLVAPPDLPSSHAASTVPDAEQQSQTNTVRRPRGLPRGTPWGHPRGDAAGTHTRLGTPRGRRGDARIPSAAYGGV